MNFLLSSFYTQGNIYIGDSINDRVRKVTVSTNIITTIAASLNDPYGVAVDSSGWIIIMLHIIPIFLLNHILSSYRQCVYR